MKKREFAELFMVKANLRSKEEAKRQVELFIETMKEALTQDDILIFRGLGILKEEKLREKKEEILEQGKL